MRKFFIMVIVIFLFFSAAAFSEEERLEASLEESSVFIGNPIYLYLTFYGAQDVERMDIPAVDGLQTQYVGPSTKVSVVNGVVSRSVTHAYLVIPRKSGKFVIGPFFVEHRGRMYKADAVILTTRDMPSASGRHSGGSSRAMPAVSGSEGGNTPYVGDRIFLVMEIDGRRVYSNLYINEVVPVTIKVYVETGLGLKDIEYPVYSHEGFSVGEFEEPQKHREVVRGVRYDVLVFRQNIFGIKEGNYVLGPARLRCKLVSRRKVSRRVSFFRVSVFDDDFFGNSKYQIYPIEIKSEKISANILPFPEEGRPEDFKGAVGDFNLDVHVDPPKVKIGDPVMLRMSLSGDGNLDTITAPHFASSEKFKIYEPQVTKKGHKKIYEQVLIPKTDMAEQIPEVSFSFFNPESGEYKTLRKGPFPLEVERQPESERTVKMVSMPGVQQMFYPGEELGRDLIHIKENIGKLRDKDRFIFESPLFCVGQIVPFVLFLGFYVKHRKKERIRHDKKYARFLRAPRKARKGLAKAKMCLGKNDTMLFYDIIHKTLQEYLGDRFNLPKGNVTIQVIEDRFCSFECDEETIKELRDIFSKCEMARYASFVSEDREAEETLEKVKKIINYLERIKV